MLTKKNRALALKDVKRKLKAVYFSLILASSYVTWCGPVLPWSNVRFRCKRRDLTLFEALRLDSSTETRARSILWKEICLILNIVTWVWWTPITSSLVCLLDRSHKIANFASTRLLCTRCVSSLVFFRYISGVFIRSQPSNNCNTNAFSIHANIYLTRC